MGAPDILLVQGTRIRYRHWGKKGNPVIVLLHAWSYDSNIFSELGQLLQYGYYVVAPDLPGHGESDQIPECSLGGFADWLNDILTELSLDRVVLVGHSLGGGIAIEFTNRYPDKVSQVVLISSSGEPVYHPFIGWVWVAVSSNLIGLSQNPWATTKAIWSWFRNCFLRGRTRWLWETLKIPTTCDLLDRLEALQGKTTVIVAEGDRFYPRYQRLCEGLKVEPTIIAGNYGHLWVITRPRVAAWFIRVLMANQRLDRVAAEAQKL